MKPEIIISYLYGELSEEESREVRAYLDDHPEAAAEMADLGAVRGFLGEAKASEAVPPLVLNLAPDVSPRPWWTHKWVPAVAAALALLLLFAGLDLRVRWQPGELSFSLGEPRGIQIPQVVAYEPDTSLRPLLRQMTARQDELSEQLAQQQTRNERLAQLIAQQPKAEVNPALSEEQLAALRQQLLSENRRLMQQLVAQSEERSVVHTAELMEDFALYLQEQRTQDLQLMTQAFNQVLYRQDAQREETEELLAMLITQVSRRGG